MSTSSGVRLTRLVSVCAQLAEEAGKIIRSVKASGNLGTISKSTAEFDPQTIADVRAQRMIIDALRQQFPRVTVVGEEDTVDTSRIEPLPIPALAQDRFLLPENSIEYNPEHIVVWVDPLDGTREFAENVLDAVTTLIGIAVNGKPIAGVIHQPWPQLDADSGRTVYGAVGLGVFGISAQPQRNESGKYRLITSRSHFSARMQGQIDLLQNSVACEVMRVGGAGAKVLYLLEGRADGYFYPEKGTKRWDSCAPEALVRAMGGEIVGWDGNTYDYSVTPEPANKLGMLGAMSREHLEIMLNAVRTYDSQSEGAK